MVLLGLPAEKARRWAGDRLRHILPRRPVGRDEEKQDRIAAFAAVACLGRLGFRERDVAPKDGAETASSAKASPPINTVNDAKMNLRIFPASVGEGLEAFFERLCHLSSMTDQRRRPIWKS
jgi:hypothetical protein